MNQKLMVRYLILIGVLIICAGAVWYIRSTSEQPAEDAVLAEVPVEKLLVDNALDRISVKKPPMDVPEIENLLEVSPLYSVFSGIQVLISEEVAV